MCCRPLATRPVPSGDDRIKSGADAEGCTRQALMAVEKGAKLIRACISRAGKLTENVPDYFRTGAVVPATIELAAR